RVRRRATTRRTARRRARHAARGCGRGRWELVTSPSIVERAWPFRKRMGHRPGVTYVRPPRSRPDRDRMDLKAGPRGGTFAALGDFAEPTLPQHPMRISTVRAVT